MDNNFGFDWKPGAPTLPSPSGIYDVCAVVNKNNGVDTLQMSDHATMQTGGFVNVDGVGIHDTDTMPTPQFNFVATEQIGDMEHVVTYAHGEPLSVTDSGVQLKP